MAPKPSKSLTTTTASQPATIRQRRAPHPSEGPLEVLDVRAVICKEDDRYDGQAAIIKAVIKRVMWRLAAVPIMMYKLACWTGRTHLVCNAIYKIFTRIAFKGVQFIDLFTRLPLYWWFRLPDRREIEHRQIAALQFIETLEDLIPDRTNASSVDDHLNEHFKQLYASRTRIGDLMNIRLVSITPEPVIQIS